MSETTSEDTPNSANSEELKRFRKLRRLINHWSRPLSPRAYYWYLTFENSSELQSLAKQCQEAISFPYYDLTLPGALHLTLDRIAFEGDITSDQLSAVEAAAIRACQGVSPLDITIGSLGGTRGAIGFTAFPGESIRRLHDTLRAATLSVYAKAPTKRSEFHPHVAIAYCNSDNVPAAEAIAAVEKLNATAPVDVTIKECVLVLLERRQRSYVWQAISRIPLAG